MSLEELKGHIGLSFYGHCPQSVHRTNLVRKVHPQNCLCLCPAHRQCGCPRSCPFPLGVGFQAVSHKSNICTPVEREAGKVKIWLLQLKVNSQSGKSSKYGEDVYRILDRLSLASSPLSMFSCITSSTIPPSFPQSRGMLLS